MGDLRILVMSSIPPPRPPAPTWGDLAQLTVGGHRKYCLKHGYEHHFDVSDIWETVPDNRRQPRPVMPIRYFVKFVLFQHYLDPEKCGEEYDAVVWLDSDLLITNYDVKLETFLNGQPGTTEDQSSVGDIILTHDVNGLHATVIMMRRTPRTLAFAWACGNAGKTYFVEDDWSDQLAMRMFLMTPPYCWMVHYHSVKTLCAMPPDTYPIPKLARKEYEWSEGDFALHLSAMTLTDRVKIASEYIERLGL